MLDGVVEHERLALHPWSRFAADTEGAACGDDQRKMHDGAYVGHARVRWDVLSSLEDREEDRRRATWNAAQRQTLHQCGRLRRSSADIVDPLAVAPQMKRAPIEGAIE